MTFDPFFDRGKIIVAVQKVHVDGVPTVLLQNQASTNAFTPFFTPLHQYGLISDVA